MLRGRDHGLGRRAAFLRRAERLHQLVAVHLHAVIRHHRLKRLHAAVIVVNLLAQVQIDHRDFL